MRSPNHSGGGAQTNVNGLGFERAKELRGIIASGTGITVSGNTVFQNGEEIAILYQKHELYKYLLKPNGIDYRDHISKKLLPDDAIYFPHLERPILYIIEKKYQNGGGSVDEKLQTCDFKKRQYTKLLSPLGIKVEYCYLLCDFFRRDCYKDVLDYIKDVGCNYFFNDIPLDYFGL